MKKNIKILFGSGLIIIAILSLLIAATPGASRSEVVLQELLNNLNKYEGKYVVTEGLLVEESIKWNAELIELNFDVQDEEGYKLSVKHHGVIPDNFSEGVIVILEGNLEQDGTFNAERLQTKCPSKYESGDQSNYDPKTHQIISSDGDK